MSIALWSAVGNQGLGLLARDRMVWACRTVQNCMGYCNAHFCDELVEFENDEKYSSFARFDLEQPGSLPVLAPHASACSPRLWNGVA